MLRKLNQAGTSAFIAILAIGLIAITAVIGYRVVNSSTDTVQTTSTDSKAGSSTETIQSSKDVTDASSQLEETNVDAQVNPEQLDSDLNSIL